MPFIIVADHRPRLLDQETPIDRFLETQKQTELFQIAG
jgi:hypothetical protein